jgi:hypothetical protein
MSFSARGASNLCRRGRAQAGAASWRPKDKDTTMRELLVDFITSLDGYASGEGWPGFWGLEGPEYLAWLGEQPEVTYLMGANTYRLMSGFAAGEIPAGQTSSPPTRRRPSTAHASVEGGVLRLARGAAHVGQLHARARRRGRSGPGDEGEGSGLMSTIGSLSLCRSLLRPDSSIASGS